MRFYGLFDREHAEVIEFYPSRDAADRELAEILHDEPDGSKALESAQEERGGMRWVRTAQFAAAWLMLVALGVQFFLAGAGAFAAESWDPHALLGFWLAIGSIVLLVLTLLARLRVLPALVLVALMVLQAVLGVLGSEEEPWIGAVHGANAVAVTGVAYTLAHRSALARRADRPGIRPES